MKSILLCAALAVALVPSAGVAAEHKKPLKCCPTSSQPECEPKIVGLPPILNYQINDALLMALQSLKASDPSAYTAVAVSFDKLPADGREALTTGLGLSITDKAVTRSVVYSQLLKVNAKLLQLDVNGLR